MPFRRYPQRRQKLGVIVGLIVVLQILTPLTARAGRIDDKQAEAAEVAAEIDSQAARITQQAKLQSRAQSRVEQARDAMARAQSELRAA